MQNWRQPIFESRVAALPRSSRIAARLVVSQVPGTSCAMGREGFLCQGIELSGMCVACNGRIEPLGIKGLEPCTEPCQLLRVQLFNGFFDVFRGRHARGYNIRKAPRKGVGDQENQTRPFTGSSAPVTALAASLTRNRITSASSCGVTHLLKSAFGMLARLAAVSMIDGSTALTVILPFRWAASASVGRCTPAFDAA